MSLNSVLYFSIYIIFCVLLRFHLNIFTFLLMLFTFCQQLCDVALIVAGEVVHAHKVILASISPYFHAMFNGE